MCEDIEIQMLLECTNNVLHSLKSENSTRDGDIRKAKSRSAVAVYLNFAAVVFAVVASDVVLGLVLAFYRHRVSVEEV